MPIKFNPVRGKPSIMKLRYLGQATALPAPVAVTVDSLTGVDAGETTLPVAALSGPIPKNTILTFTRAAGDPAEVVLVTTADAAAGATEIHVEDFFGADGDGTPVSLADDDEAEWDGLYTDIASQNLDYQNNAQTQTLNPVTHGSGSGITAGIPEVQSVAPTVPRTGLFFDDHPLIRDLIRYGDTNGNWWAELQVPGADGLPYLTYSGLAIVQNVGHPQPADDLVQLSYTVAFKGLPAKVFRE